MPSPRQYLGPGDGGSTTAQRDGERAPSTQPGSTGGGGRLPATPAPSGPPGAAAGKGDTGVLPPRAWGRAGAWQCPGRHGGSRGHGRAGEPGIVPRGTRRTPSTPRRTLAPRHLPRPTGREEQDPCPCQARRDERGRKRWTRDKIAAIGGTRGARRDGAHVSRPVCPRRQKQLAPGRCGQLARHPGDGRARSAASSAPSAPHSQRAPRPPARGSSELAGLLLSPASLSLHALPGISSRGVSAALRPPRGTRWREGTGTRASPTVLWRHRCPAAARSLAGSRCHHAGSPWSHQRRGPQGRHQHQPPEEGGLGAHLHRLRLRHQPEGGGLGGGQWWQPLGPPRGGGGGGRGCLPVSPGLRRGPAGRGGAGTDGDPPLRPGHHAGGHVPPPRPLGERGQPRGCLCAIVWGQGGGGGG